MIKSWLARPLTRGLDLDDPETTALRLQIIREKGFLRTLYLAWYGDLAASLPPGEGAVLEIGAGAGFLKELVPDILTSDILPVPGLDLVADARTFDWVCAQLEERSSLDRLEARGTVRLALKQAGLEPRHVHTVLITHSHPDLSGGAVRIHKESGARIVRESAPTLEDIFVARGGL